MAISYPDNCIQALCTPWWEKTEKPQRERCFLAEAFVRHACQQPYILEPVGRRGASDHHTAEYNLTTLEKNPPPPPITTLPIAAIPHVSGDILAITRAKFRPVLLIALPGTTVENELRKNASRAKFAPTYLAAPYYSALSGGIREGFNPEFITRVKGLHYTQFFWDYLPHDGGHESILRLDHIQPIEPSTHSLKPLPWRLTDEAQEVMLEAIQFHLAGVVPDQNSIWAIAKKALADHP